MSSSLIAKCGCAISRRDNNDVVTDVSVCEKHFKKCKKQIIELADTLRSVLKKEYANAKR